MKKLYITLIGLLLLSLFAAGCAQKQEVIKVGAVLPLSGEAATYGQAAKKGIELAAQQINSRTDGKKIEIIYEDSKIDPKLAVSSFQKLMSFDEVQYVIGFSSGETLAMCPLAEANKVLLFSSGSSPDITTECGDYTFRDFPSDIYQGKVLAEKLKSKELNTIALLYANTPYGSGLKKSFENEFDGQIVASEAFSGGDFKTQLSKIDAKNPEAMVVILEKPGDITRFLKQKKELGIELPVFGSETLKNDELLSTLTENELGELYTVFIAEYIGPEAENYRSSYKATYGSDPGIYSDYVHDNVLVLGEALQLCEEQDCVKQALNDMQFVGATGFIDFDQNGDVVNKPYALYKATETGFVTVS